MDQATRTALEESIVAWESKLEAAKLGEYDKISLGARTCPLCVLFYDKGCGGCPISKRTGRSNCEETPFDDVFLMFLSPVKNKETHRSLLVRHIFSEIAFLRSL